MYGRQGSRSRVQLDLLLSGKPQCRGLEGACCLVVTDAARPSYGHPCTGQVQSRGMSSCQIPPLSVLVLTVHAFQERTAPAFLSVNLDALDEGLLTSISTHKSSSTTIKVEELNEEPQLDDGQTEVGK